jgi:DNA-binding HxlR family transcriptional regulator
MDRNRFDRWTCPTQKAVELVGDRWSLFIIREFIFGKQTNGFNELLRFLEPISSRTLALKLAKLQKNGLLTRKVVQARPLKVEYRITVRGLALKKSLQALADWHNQQF